MTLRDGLIPEDATIELSGAGETYIITENGEKLIAPSRRPDGTIRKPIKIRPGFMPLEERRKYVAKGARQAEDESASKRTDCPAEDAPASLQAVLNEARHPMGDRTRQTTKDKASCLGFPSAPTPNTESQASAHASAHKKKKKKPKNGRDTFEVIEEFEAPPKAKATEA